MIKIQKKGRIMLPEEERRRRRKEAKQVNEKKE